jgi:orotate phosphoribosyltransferase
MDKANFIHFCLAEGALHFGEFRLKSGRLSPYFFNLGVIHRGAALARLGAAYAMRLRDENIDVLFGPAYKGIPLVVTTAIQLERYYGRDLPIAYNRKEIKTHGEGGQLVGAPLTGNVWIIDDVMTAGTAVRESLGLIQAAGATARGVIVSLDRQERGQQGLSAVQEIQQEYHIPVLSLITLTDILEYVRDDPQCREHQNRLAEYQAAYGLQ